MEFKSFLSILSRISIVSNTPLYGNVKEVEEEVEEVEATELIRSESYSVDTKSKENPYNESDFDSIEEEDEVSVEKAFSELSGRRKTITFESLIGWDIVAELLQDGALNTDVRTARTVRTACTASASSTL
jgi:hypothetical protein